MQSLRFTSGVLNRVTQTTFRSGALPAVRITQQAPSLGSRILLRRWCSNGGRRNDQPVKTKPPPLWWESVDPGDVLLGLAAGIIGIAMIPRVARMVAVAGPLAAVGVGTGATGLVIRYTKVHAQAWPPGSYDYTGVAAELRQVTGASLPVPALRSAVRAVLEQRGRLITFSAKGACCTPGGVYSLGSVCCRRRSSWQAVTLRNDWQFQMNRS